MDSIFQIRITLRFFVNENHMISLRMNIPVLVNLKQARIFDYEISWWCVRYINISISSLNFVDKHGQFNALGSKTNNKIAKL